MRPTVHAPDTATTTNPDVAPTATDGAPGPESVRSGRHGVLVVAPMGQLDRAGVERLRREVLEAGGPVAVDLDECILVDPGAVTNLDLGDTDHPDLCFVSRRVTCRLLLARFGMSARFAVFNQLEDALQAKVLADAGYGPGWRVD
jgi:hypothetical protein